MDFRASGSWCSANACGRNATAGRRESQFASLSQFASRTLSSRGSRSLAGAVVREAVERNSGLSGTAVANIIAGSSGEARADWSPIAERQRMSSQRGRHMRFILVNRRTLSRRTFCMLCSRPIGASYLKELRTGLPFCGHDCYALYCDRWVARVSHPTCSTVAPNPRSSARAKASCQLGPPSVADKKPVHRPVKPGDPS